MTLEEKLHKIGCEIGPDEFRDLILGLFTERYPGFTVDQLVSDWRKTRDFARFVRRKLDIRCSDLVADVVIISTILNMRKKAGNLPTYYR